MTLRQTAYYMALVGGLAGLVCWLGQTLVSDFARFESATAQITIYAMLMGTLISGMGVFFGDLWSGDRPKLLWIGSGLVLGLAAGLFTGGAYRFLLAGDAASGASQLSRVLVWCVAGASIGFVTGLRWLEVNRWRPLHGLIGGAVGGAAGGVVFLVAGTSEIFQALAFILIGVGITLGVTLASVLLRDAVLRFVGSESGEAAELYGGSGQEWVLQRGDRTWIGNMGAEMTTTFYSRGVQVFLPDEQLQPRHAVIFDRGGEFVIEPYRGALDFEEPAPTRVNGQPVDGATPLHDGAVITIGSTSLAFALQPSLLGGLPGGSAREPAAEPELPVAPATKQHEPAGVETPAAPTAGDAVSPGPAVEPAAAVSTLADLILPGPQDPAFVLPHFIAACRAVAQDLETGRSHPTLSPTAVRLEALGGARIASQDASRPGDSTRRIIPRYAAPELFRSREGGAATPPEQTEIYVLGHIFYETLLGQERHRREFEGVYSADDPTYPWYQWHSGPEEATPLSDSVAGIPEALSDVVSRMMRKDEARRPATVSEVLDTLTSIEDELTEAERSTIIRKPAQAGPIGSRGWLPWLIVGAALLALILLWSVAMGTPARKQGGHRPADATSSLSGPISGKSCLDPG